MAGFVLADLLIDASAYGRATVVTGRGLTERRILLPFMRYGSIAQPASLVRGSSRRITIVRFRPADIRVINRRICLSSCCLLCRPSLRRIERKTQPGVNVTLDRVAPYQKVC